MCARIFWGVLGIKIDGVFHDCDQFDEYLKLSQSAVGTYQIVMNLPVTSLENRNIASITSSVRHKGVSVLLYKHATEREEAEDRRQVIWGRRLVFTSWLRYVSQLSFWHL